MNLGRLRSPGPISVGTAAIMGLMAGVGGCRAPDLSLRPDSVLRAELGLTDADRVHRVVLRGGTRESADPPAVEVLEGDWVEFVSADWRVHEVRFEGDSLDASAGRFLTGSDQVASPPLLEPDSRFVVSFSGAPEGRYPYVVEGNGSAVRGVVVVVPKR